MKKQITKKATTPKKETPVVQKKNQKTNQKEEPQTTEELFYPPWTTPEHLSEKDHKALKKFYELFTSGNINSAFSFASNFNIEVRGAIPLEILLEEQLIPTRENNVETSLTP